MKKYRIALAVSAVLVLLSGCGSSKKELNAYMSEQDEIMDEMMEKMDDVEPSGSAAATFLNQMIPHHQSAVKMSQSYLQHAGEKGEFKELAEQIISTQEDEIKQMSEMAARILDEGKADEEQETLYLEEYEGMMKSHHMAHDSQAKSLDRAFAEGMSMHHQMAVDMSKAILNHTDEEEVIRLANAIITQQEKEIQQMEQENGGHAH
ncbi:DUF305 domain-containing protein [Qiania dongpingensis]|uniref:DUF305 domain-containing protein n=1 Tax=Qiania dongpingensis TaxID=2763669 RepID=A0A7G9G342_9FIRM|nr:DUF305 domain-containing protein [Qiania dongpingensis]QNM05224.1 DUF305 domain-containing protein [Qiania dongpingensis]